MISGDGCTYEQAQQGAQILDERDPNIARAGEHGVFVMKLLSLQSRTIAALVMAPVSFAFVFQTALAQSSQLGATGPVSTAPSVSVPAGTPCEVDLLNVANGGILEEYPAGSTYGDANFTYAPPANCPGPWAKVVLKVTVQEPFSYRDTTQASIRLGDVQIYAGTMSNLPAPAAAAFPVWEVERDVTDFSSLFTTAQNGVASLVSDQSYWQNLQDNTINMWAQLLFYPASSASPAQKTPDAVVGLLTGTNTVALPHNIVRAYVDIYNQEPWWFTCVPDQEFNQKSRPFWSGLAIGAGDKIGDGVPGEGCGGGSFAEIGVNIDGTPAGIAPVFPLLSSTYNFTFFNALNAPTQPSQLLNYVPYRVDLTPFAAVLNQPGQHTIALSRQDAANLLIYEDKGSNQVSGAVLLNTLASSGDSPTVTDSIHPGGDSLSGQITTKLDRGFIIEGYVNTSKGRVDASVEQASHFQNTQDFYLDGLTFPNYREYRQHVQLASQTLQHSQRIRAGLVLSDDLVTTSYPLDLLYDMTGYVLYADINEAYPLQGTVSATQHRNLDAVHLKHDAAPYASQVRDNFVSTNTYNTVTGKNSNWQSQADYHFYDTQGSCYQSALTALNGVVATEANGADCPNGQNAVLWFAHPDGSPDSLGWAH